MNVYRYPNFKYSPFIISDEDLKCRLDLEGLGLEEDDSEMEVFAHKHLDKSFVFDTMFMHFQEFSYTEKMQYWNDLYLKSFPKAINARINLVNFHDQKNAKTTDFFKTVFEFEIDLLLNNKSSDIILSDEYYNNLLVFLTHSFYQIGEVENAKSIYKYVLSFGNQNSIEELAFVLRGIEFDDFLQFNYVANLMLLKRNIFEWHEEMLKHLGRLNPRKIPHNSIAYKILNKETSCFSESDIVQLDDYDNNLVDVYEDLIWVLYNGFLRQFAGEDFFKEHFIFNTLIVAAHFRVRPFLSDFIYLLSEMPEQKNIELFGDEFDETCLPSLTVLAADNLTPILDCYEKDGEASNLLVSVIVRLSMINVQESKRAADYTLRKIKEQLLHKDIAALNYWLIEIIVQKLDGYAWLVDLAEDEDWFEDVAVKDTYESPREIDYLINQKENISDVTIDDLLYYFRALDEMSNPLSIDLDGIIDSVVLITNDRNTDVDFIKDIEKNEFINGGFDAFKGIDVEKFLDLKNEPIKFDQSKIGRNFPCPCGSGKKYKQCCLSSN